MAYKDKEKNKEYNRLYYLEHKDKLLPKKTEYQKEYSKTQMGRAQKQYRQYKFMDKRNGFGDVIDFDAKWIVENIYTQKCKYCDETDWHKLGCNRIDNSKPHTKDNVEPCCFYHNCVLNGLESTYRLVESSKQRSKKVSQYTLDGNLVKTYNSTSEAEKETHIRSGNISRCCSGNRPTAGGFRWEYV
jgi:hypothetical protein